MNGLFHACHKPVVAEKAEEFVRGFCRRAFRAELSRTDVKSDPARLVPEAARRRFLPLTSALADAFVNTIGSALAEHREPLGVLLATIISDFKAMVVSPEFADKLDGQRSTERFISAFSQKFIGLCQEEDWSRKIAGITAINVFINKIDISRRLLIESEIDFVRAMFFIIRDAPKDAPSSVDQVITSLHNLIRTCQAQEDGKAKTARLTEVLVAELYSQSLLCRTTTQDCIALLAEVTNQTVSALILPAAKLRLLDPVAGPIFSKPLRALPFPMQVGNIDAFTYLVDLRPSVPESSEEFLRLLQEVLALADVDDANLIGKQSTHKQDYWLKTLRVACLRMLRATMALPDFFAKPNLAAFKTR
jgi:transformation/transcription domain-associated protein